MVVTPKEWLYMKEGQELSIFVSLYILSQVFYILFAFLLRYNL